jgi:hypothetical protein
MDNQDRRSISHEPNVTDELLKLGDLGPKMAAERAKIPMVTQGWVTVKGGGAADVGRRYSAKSASRKGHGKPDEDRKSMTSHWGLFGYEEEAIVDDGSVPYDRPMDYDQAETQRPFIIANGKKWWTGHWWPNTEGWGGKSRGWLHQPWTDGVGGADRTGGVILRQDDILNYVSANKNRNTWVAPGASFELIRQKIDEGFIIEFEDEDDRARL